MKKKFNKNYLEKYSRQIVLKDIGILGQKKISLSKILIVGLGGLGCPAVDYLCRAGVGQIGLVDFDKVSCFFKKSIQGQHRILGFPIASNFNISIVCF